jgi:Tfp pilus assembly protein PilX
LVAIMTGLQWMGRDERGSILVSGMMLMLVMTLIGSGVFYASVLDNRLAINDTRQSQTFYIAEAGLNTALRELADGDGTNDFTSVFNAAGTTTLFTNKAFGIGSFTVTAQAVTGSSPQRITVTSTGCMSIPTGANLCPASSTQVNLRTEIVSQIQLAGPFFALGKFTLAGNGALVDSFDSSDAGCQSNMSLCYATTVCHNTASPFCGANVFADGAGSSASTTTVSIGNNTSVYGKITDALGVVSINGSANIYGDVIYAPSPNGSCSGCATPNPVHGTPTPLATTPPVVPAVPICSPFTSASVLSSYISGTGPYSYNQATGDFSLAANKTVTLAPLPNDKYCFHTMTLQGTLTVNSTTNPVIISLTGGMSVSSNGSIANTTSKAVQFQVVSSAVCSSSCSAPTNSIQLSGGADAYLYIYAPKTQVVASGGGNLYGALLGNDLQVSGGSRLHYDKALGNAGNLAGGIPSYTWNPGAWKNCNNPTCT